MTKVINIADKLEFYNKIITLMNLIVDLKLIPTEIRVLSKLYYERDMLITKGLSDEELGIILFNSEMRSRLREELNMSYSVYNNLLSSLRNRKNLIDGNTLHPFFTNMSKFKDDKFKLILEFKLNGVKES